MRLVPKLPPEWLSDGETSSLGGRSQKSCLIPAARNTGGSEAGQSPDISAEDPTQDSKLQQRAASMDSGDRLLMTGQLTRRESKAGSGACSLDGARQECGSTDGSLPDFHSPHSSLSQRSMCPHGGALCSESTVSQLSPAGDAALDRGQWQPQPCLQPLSALLTDEECCQQSTLLSQRHQHRVERCIAPAPAVLAPGAVMGGPLRPACLPL